MTNEFYSAALARYQAIAMACQQVEVKGKANPYTSINGNMFSFLDKSGTLCLRLSQTDREEFVSTHRTKPVEQYGSIMKEYVAVPETVALDKKAMQIYFGKCLNYAISLPVKPTKKD